MKQILLEVVEEREKQDKRWGGSKHDDKHLFSDWIFFIGDYLKGRRGKNYRDRMIKIAALAVAAVESYDRKMKNENAKS